MKRSGLSLSLAICIAVALLGDTAKGANSSIPGPRYTSGRGAAMGDAFIGLSEDGPAGLFYNPAGLGLIKRAHIEIANLQFAFHHDYFKQFNLNFFNLINLKNYVKTLRGTPGGYPGLGAQFTPAVFIRGIGFGLQAETRMGARFNEADGTVTYRTLYQLIPAAGIGLRLAQGIVRIGYSVQWINKTSGSQTLDQNDSNLSYRYGMYQGSGLSHNVGWGVTLPYRFLPSLNIVVRNLAGVKYGATSLVKLAQSSPGAPPDDPMSIDAAFSFQPKFGHGGTMNVAVDFRDALGTSGFSAIKRLHTGLEISFSDFFFLRGGYGAGYPAAGLGLKRGVAAEFALTWYSEEVGTPTQKIREARFLAHYQIKAF